MFGLGVTELVIILVLVLLLFGAGRVSKVMRELGTGVQAFKSAVNENSAQSPAQGLDTSPDAPASATPQSGQKSGQQSEPSA